MSLKIKLLSFSFDRVSEILRFSVSENGLETYFLLLRINLILTVLTRSLRSRKQWSHLGI